MRTHTQIIDDAGAHAIARLITPHVEGDADKVQKRVRAWRVIGSIPGEYWPLLERLGVASMAELAADAAARKGVIVPANDSTTEVAA